MAAAQAQLAGLVNNQQSLPLVKWAAAPLFGDVPNEDGMLNLLQMDQWLHSISRGGSTLGANAEGTDPGAGGGGNATVQAQHNDRNIACRIAILSLIQSGSRLYNLLSQAPFANGRQIRTYLRGAGIVYLRPTDDVAQARLLEVQSWTYLDMPVKDQDENLVLNFKAKLEGYNPKLHPNMVMPNNTMIATFCNGLHPEAKLLALEMKTNLPLAVTNGCCNPVNFPAYHPNGGNPHPNAGQLNLDLLALYVHNKFSMKLRAGLFRLKAVPGINQTSEFPDTTMDEYCYASIDDAQSANYHNFHDYVCYSMDREASRHRTCNNCGGVNHLSHKDGVFVCPTPLGSVPIDMLRHIRYPFGIRPWVFGTGKGKGKAKGKGKPSARGVGGRGRGTYATWDDDSVSHEHEPIVDVPSARIDNDDEAVATIHDDFDGFNLWD